MTTDDLPLTQDLVGAWQAMVDTMAMIVGVPAGLIMRLSGEEIEVFVSSRTENNPYKPGDKEHFFDSGLYCETVVRSGDPLLVPDALADPDWEGNPDVKLGMISYLGLPILLPDGNPFGTICILDNKANPFSDLYLRLLTEFKSMVEGHLRLAVLNRALDEKNHELESALAEVQDLREILPVCMKCKRVRDDDGYWARLEAYLAARRNIVVSHGLCPTCADEWEKELEASLSDT